MSARRERGVALLVALLVVALAVLLIAGLLDHGQLASARVRNQLRASQAQAWAQGLEAWAAQVLVRDTADGQLDSNEDVWAMPLPPTPVPGGSIRGAMQDRNGCFNLNNLYHDGQLQAVWMERFRRLLLQLDLSPAIADAAADWIDPDQSPRDGGAEDRRYLARTPAYLAANRPFVDASELRLVAGVDDRAWHALQPWVCALPSATALNLNTASVPLLMSLGTDITAPLAERVHRDGKARWSSVEAALRELGPAGLAVCPQPTRAQCGLSVSSEYFQAQAWVELDGIHYVFTSLMQRRGGVRVLRRRPGGA